MADWTGVNFCAVSVCRVHGRSRGYRHRCRGLYGALFEIHVDILLEDASILAGARDIFDRHAVFFQ